ncbi:DUF362 domain-containing protein [Candidatus Poribacteria bacterium]|nr:DUF362 domain-containing protein [Candidatus Poribacteria bacterium]
MKESKRYSVEFFKCTSFKDIQSAANNIFDGIKNRLPSDVSARILIKPNLNSNFNALTGNTTDLRLIAATIQSLKSLGYSNIAVGDGTNSGFYREGISVIGRLGVDRLAKYYNVQVIDLNHDDIVEIDFEDGVKAGVAKSVIESDFLINMPKLKMHYEADMSVCLKNLIGCCVGRDNKKKVHYKLIHNILNLNRQIKPHLHIVDGIIAMEGTGPSRGTPVNLGLVLAGDDPYFLDMVCAEIVGLGYQGVRTLRLAEESGHITKEYVEALHGLDISSYHKKFKLPDISLITSLAINPRIQPYLLKIRYAPVIRQICSTKMIRKFIYFTGLGHEYINKDEGLNTYVQVDHEKCHNGKNCIEEKKCLAYCPIGLDTVEFIGGSECIQCMYCYSVCPQRAIEIQGELGYFADQIKRYDNLIRSIIR